MLTPDFKFSASLATLALFVCFAPGTAVSQSLPISTSSKEAEALFTLGRLHAFHYQIYQSVEYLDRAIAIDSTFLLAYLHRAGMSPTNAEFEAAFAKADQYRDSASAAERRLYDAFDAFMRKGEAAEAASIFSELAEEFPDDPYLPTYLGLRNLRNLQNFDEAALQFERAIERDPLFVQAINWLGYAEMARGNLEAAEDAFLRYASAVPDEPRPHISLGDLYRQKGNIAQAAAHYGRALEVDPDFSLASDKLALLEIQRLNGAFEKAFAAGNGSTLASLYSPFAQIIPDDAKPVVGREDIRTYWAGVIAAGFSSVHLETSEMFTRAAGRIEPNSVIVYEQNFVTEIGRYRMFKENEESDSGTYVAVWIETGEGWYLFRDVWTSEWKRE